MKTSIFKAIDVAVALGVELFTLDAQWWDLSGDWVPSKTRFSHGLKAVSDYARKKGLFFGRYVETEGGRGPIKKSKMGREHPDWLLGSKKSLPGDLRYCLQCSYHRGIPFDAPWPVGPAEGDVL